MSRSLRSLANYDVTVKVTEVNGESAADLHLCMASRTPVDPLIRPLVHWTVEQLKDFLRDRRLPVSGTKAELITRVGLAMIRSSLNLN